MTPDDERSHAALFRAVDQGWARIDVDPRRVRHMDCPVSGAAYHTSQIYLSGVACLGAFAVVGPIPAAAIVVGIVALNVLVLARLVDRLTRGHVVDRVRRRPDLWEKLWWFGGIAVTTADGVVETAPKGDWRRVAATAPPPAVDGVGGDSKLE